MMPYTGLDRTLYQAVLVWIRPNTDHQTYSIPSPPPPLVDIDHDRQVHHSALLLLLLDPTHRPYDHRNSLPNLPSSRPCSKPTINLFINHLQLTIEHIAPFRILCNHRLWLDGDSLIACSRSTPGAEFESWEQRFAQSSPHGPFLGKLYF